MQSTPIAVIARHRWNRKSKSLTTKDTKNEKVDRLKPTPIWDTLGWYGMNGEGVGDRRNRRHRATSPESEKQELNHKGREERKSRSAETYANLGYPGMVWDERGGVGACKARLSPTSPEPPESGRPEPLPLIHTDDTDQESGDPPNPPPRAAVPHGSGDRAKPKQGQLRNFRHAFRQRLIVLCRLVILKRKRFLLRAVAHPYRRE